MNDKIINIEDREALFRHYGRLSGEGATDVMDFFEAIEKQFPCEDPTWYNSFTRYIDGQTHIRMIRAGFIDNHEESHENWGRNYGLNEEGYRTIRSVTLEKFVIKTLEKLREGVPLDKNYVLHMSLE